LNGEAVSQDQVGQGGGGRVLEGGGVHGPCGEGDGAGAEDRETCIGRDVGGHDAAKGADRGADIRGDIGATGHDDLAKDVEDGRGRGVGGDRVDSGVGG